MNFVTEFKKGQTGGNKGIPMGKGLSRINNAINGVQKGRMYGIGASPKVGKSTLADYGFVIQPYLYAIEHNIPIEWIYFSLEIDRVSKEFEFASYFLYNDFGIEFIKLEDGLTKDGESIIGLSPDYLRGRLISDQGEVVKVKPEVEKALKEVYYKRIIPLFGEFNGKGKQIKSGLITMIEEKDNPTGIYYYLLGHAEKYGAFITVPAGKDQNGNEKRRIVGYEPRDPNKFTIVVTDHLRKLLPERGFKMKETVDKYVSYTVDIRNWCGYTFVHIIHLNRWNDVMRMKASDDILYPTSDDIKDTGNLSEDADYVFTMFNPNDERYRLSKHFGIDIRDTAGNLLYPDMRTVHLVESRHCSFPQHFKVKMQGGLKSFTDLKVN